MTLTLLLHLDDTLLNTNLEAFIPAYFQAIAYHLQPRLGREQIARALVAGMNVMNSNEDPRRTLREVFEAEFCAQLEIQEEVLGEPFSEFFQQILPTLAGHTQQNPEAIRFVEWAAASGCRIAIATDPLLYHAATEQRIRWAGFDTGRFALFSSADHFHFTKSHPTTSAGPTWEFD